MMNPTSSDSLTLEDCVLFDTYPTDCGHYIAEMTLNDPKALNALSVEMCQLISAKLTDWQHDDKIVAILLRGSGDKAFCAGGNIRKLYDSMVQSHSESEPVAPNPYATEFFGSEYALYRQMHFYQKPIILWGDGIVMGGGMGLMAACSHRVVTEATRFAMPEITIGLFPDASGSWFLQRMPAKAGLFLGLTGAMCNAADAMLCNLAEAIIPSGHYESLVAILVATDWRNKQGRESGSLDERHLNAVTSRALSQISHQLEAKLELKPSKIAQYWQAIHSLMSSGGLYQIDSILQDDDKLNQLDSEFAADRWLQKAVTTYRKGCPVTAALTYKLYQQVAALSLEQILYLETNVAINCANNPDFKEGVRALLIDKDKNPKWSRSMAECLTPEGQDYIDSHFNNIYPDGAHPFNDWLTDQACGVRATGYSSEVCN